MGTERRGQRLISSGSGSALSLAGVRHDPPRVSRPARRRARADEDEPDGAGRHDRPSPRGSVDEPHDRRVLGGIDPSSLAYALIVLAETNPYDPLIGGLLLAVELIEDRRQWRADEVASMR